MRQGTHRRAQLVDSCNILDIMSVDQGGVSGYYEAFCARTKEARENMRHKWSMQTMADRLGVTYDAYAKYETRSPMPHHLIEIFCDFTQVTMDWLVGKTPEIKVAARVPAKRPVRERIVKRKARRVRIKSAPKANSSSE